MTSTPAQPRQQNLLSNEARRGFCLILSSPSGAGKTTLAKRLLAADKSLTLSVSVTTRPPRSGEVNGVDYTFISHDAFEALRHQGGFLEWAEVFGNLYGTPLGAVQERLNAGQDLIFDVDWQGARSIVNTLPGDVATVFILPPSRDELARRLVSRASEPAAVIERRLNAASAEISHWHEYEYVIVHDNVEHSLVSLLSIVAAERLRRNRRLDLEAFTQSLMVEPRPQIDSDQDNALKS